MENSLTPRRFGRSLRALVAVLAVLATALVVSPAQVSAAQICDDAYTCPGPTGSIQLEKFLSFSDGCADEATALVAGAGDVTSVDLNDGQGAITTVYRVELFACYRMTNNTTATLQGHAIFDQLAIPVATLPAPGVVDPAFFVAPGATLSHSIPGLVKLRTDFLGVPLSIDACAEPQPISDGNLARWESRIDASTVVVDFVSNNAGTTIDVTAACASLP